MFYSHSFTRSWALSQHRLLRRENGEKTVSSTSDVGKAGQLHVNNEIRTFPHSIYKNKLEVV